MYVCIYIFTYILYTCIQRTHTYITKNMYASMHSHNTHACTHTTHACTHTHRDTCGWFKNYFKLLVLFFCACACVCSRVHVWCIRIY